MKKLSQKALSLLLALMVIVSSVSTSFVALAADDTVETVVNSDVMSVEPYEAEETYEEEIECEVDEFVESDETSVELSEDDVVESMNLTNGVSDLDLGITEDEVANPVDNGEMIEADDAPLEDNLGEFVESEGVSEDDVETEFAVLRFEASQDKIDINQGGTSKITLTYWGFYGGVKVNATKSNNNISGIIEKKSGTKFELTITGNYVGTSKIVVKLYSSKGEFLKDETINVTVKKTNYISIQKNRADLLAGKSATIGVNLNGSQIYSISSSGAGCDYTLKKCSWYDVTALSYNYKLEIKGTNVGTTKITIFQKNSSGAVLDKKTITVNVSRNATVTPSMSNVSVDIGASKSISFTNKNAYGNLKYSFSLSNANCVTSWNGKSLTITGKRAGTTNITVKLYDGNGNHLASTNVTVTSKRNPKLTPNVSTVNLIPAQKSKVNIKLTGYDGGVYAKYSSSNPSVCGLSWSGSWSNNSITMTAYGYKQGSTKVTIYLYDSLGNQLTTTSVTIKVTGTPSISTNSSYDVNMGAQKLFAITIKNVASNYKLSFNKTGNSFTASWKKIGNVVFLIVKGTREGNGNITVTLKSDDGTVLTNKTIPVKILWVENPQITLSKDKISFTENKSDNLSISCTGTKKEFSLAVSHSGKKTDPKLNFSFSSSSKASATLTVSCINCYSTSLTIQMIEKGTGKVLATQKVSVDVLPDTSEFNNLTYGTRNYGADIPLSTFRYMYDSEGNARPSTLAQSMYDNKHTVSLNGVCYGFATTSMLFRNRTVLTSAFGASTIRSINAPSRFINQTLNISAKRFIEGMFIMQWSSLARRIYNLDSMCDTISNGNRVLICFWGSSSIASGGHAVVGYKFDPVRHRIYIADSNNITGPRYIQLTQKNGKYTGWSFENLAWSGGTEDICYQTMANVNNMWNSRANTRFDDTLANTLFTNSSSFTINDVEGNVIANYSNGVLTSNDENIYEIRDISYVEDPDYPSANDEQITRTFSLPTQFYVINNNDNSIDNFDAEMVNYDYGVSVSTEADQVAFGIDDSADLCSISLSLGEGESYDVTLLSSREGEENIRVEGEAAAESVELGLAMVEGQLTETNSDGATVNLNGTADNYYTIEARATEGGTISPEGKSNVIEGTDYEYTITPDDGYFISEVLVNGEPVGAVEKYTFHSLDEDSIIEARFEKLDLTVCDIDVDKNTHNIISWQPARASNGYEIYRKYLDGEWECIADVESDNLQYVDEEVNSRYYAYSYSVKAYSYDGERKIYGAFDDVGSKIDKSEVVMSISKLPDKTEYFEGETFDVTGLEVMLTYSDKSSETFNAGYTCDVSALNEAGRVEVPVSFEDFSTSFYVNVKQRYYNVSWDIDGEIYSDRVMVGSSITIPNNPEKDGYAFAGWYPCIPDVMPESDLTFTAVWDKIPNEPEYDYSFSIQDPSMTTIRHKDGIKLHTKLEGTAPKGSYVKWTASNGKFKTEEINDGNSLKIISDSNGKTTFTATLYSADGEVLATDTMEMKSKAGFFDKIGSFFRSIFGTTKFYEY